MKFVDLGEMTSENVVKLYKASDSNIHVATAIMKVGKFKDK